jgi:DNA-binding response OmpR family regulator
MDKNRILIVEDEPAIGRMLDMNLRVVGYDTKWFDDGTAAVAALQYDHGFDLAVLDIMVPGRDGFQIMEELKPYEIPVIFLTAKGDIDSKVRGLSGGAEDYLVKPFEMLELLLRIEKILKRRNSVSSVIRVLDLEIDTGEHTVKKSGQEILLKPMEFDLLVVLAKNKNRAISREKLLSMVWGTDFMGESRTVDVHIAQLRKKLDLGTHIKTVSKLGYRLEE